jgi:hypothetical protein
MILHRKNSESRDEPSPLRPESTADEPNPFFPICSLCVYCDYDLFYGTNEAKKKVIEKRKKTLARRRRAKERASGVANGTAKAAKKTTPKTAGGGKRANMRSRGVGDDGVDDEVEDDEYRPEGTATGVPVGEEDEWDCEEEGVGGEKCQTCAERREHEKKCLSGTRKKGRTRSEEGRVKVLTGETRLPASA